MEYQPKGNRQPKNLRNNANEFSSWVNDQGPVEEPDHSITRQKYGRSSGTNN